MATSDTIVGGNTSDRIDGRAGDDLIFGSGVGGAAPAMDPAGGGLDRDTLGGGKGDDLLWVDDGNDKLSPRCAQASK